MFRATILDDGHVYQVSLQSVENCGSNFLHKQSDSNQQFDDTYMYIAFKLFQNCKLDNCIQLKWKENIQNVNNGDPRKYLPQFFYELVYLELFTQMLVL